MVRDEMLRPREWAQMDWLMMRDKIIQVKIKRSKTND